LRRCLEAEPVIAEDAGYQDAQQESFDYQSGNQEAFVASNRVSQLDASLPKKTIVSKPRLSLRSFFPENWLFSLQMVEGDQGLERWLQRPLKISALLFCAVVVGCSSIGGGGGGTPGLSDSITSDHTQFCRDLNQLGHLNLA